MPDYSKGLIYMLEPTVEYEAGDVYYGSSTQPLYKRLHQHKIQRKTSSKHLFEKYGNNIKIVLIKAFPCNSKQELLAEEGKYIRENQCVNKCIAGRSQAEYTQEHKEEKKAYDKVYAEKHKEKRKAYSKAYRQEHQEERNAYDNAYYQTHKEEINEKQKAHYQEHKEEKKEYDKAYRQKHKEEKIARDKAYYQKHKEKIKEQMNQKIKCVCGCMISKTNLIKHKLSNKHTKLLADNITVQ
jgi:hypothetical protein